MNKLVFCLIQFFFFLLNIQPNIPNYVVGFGPSNGMLQ